MGEIKITSAGSLRQQVHSEKGVITVPTADEEAATSVVERGAAVFIDCEHGVIPLQSLPNLAKHAHQLGGVVIIRTKSAQPSSIADYVPFRPSGLVIPNVESKDTCAAIHQATIDATHATTQPALIVQIESVAGVEKTREIATAPGIDAVLIGPNDLATSMGLTGQPQHPAVVAAVNQVAEQLCTLKVPFGLPVTPETIDQWRQKGARLLFMMPQHFNRS